MDAPAVAAAAVAVAVLHAQAAAIEQLLRERERAAMANEDARSYIARSGTSLAQSRCRATSSHP